MASSRVLTVRMSRYLEQDASHAGVVQLRELNHLWIYIDSCLGQAPLEPGKQWGIV